MRWRSANCPAEGDGRSRIARKRLLTASGPILILALVLAAEALGCRASEIPNLGVLILATVLYSTFVGGAGAGLVGGTIALGYYAYGESIPGTFFRYTPANLERVLTTSGGVVLTVLFLGHLHRRLYRQLARERALRVEADEAHRQTTEILSSITDAFFSVDREWRYTFVNRAAEQLVQKSKEELLGKILWDEFPPFVGSAWEREYRRAVAERVAVDFEAYYAPLDAWFEARAYPSPDGLAMYLTDITQRKRAQEAARRLEREEASRAAAEAAVRARDEVLAIVSHDLRNPLHSISLATRLLDEPLPEPRRRKQVQIIGRAADRMNRLIQDLLDIGRIEAGQMVVAVEPLDLESLLKEAREALEMQASERSLRLDVEVEGSSRAYVDRDRFLQALSNLVGNAIKFTPPEGRIVMRARPAGHHGGDPQTPGPAGPHVEVSVSDTGPGIPADQIPRLFDRFWQACRTDRRGAGLGLSIVKGIIEAHGGRVWAESELGKGTTVRFTLRAVDSDCASKLEEARGAA